MTTEWEAKRRLILRCAGDVFITRGFDRGTTKEIAELAGLSQSSIYHYVGAKTDLLTAMLEHMDAEFGRALDEAMVQSDLAVEQVRAVIDSYIRCEIENVAAWTLFWEQQHSLPAETAKWVHEDKARYVRRVTDLVRRCQDSGDLPKSPPSRILTEVLLGAMAGVYKWYRPDGPYTVDEIIESFWVTFGLGKE